MRGQYGQPLPRPSSWAGIVCRLDRCQRVSLPLTGASMHGGPATRGLACNLFPPMNKKTHIEDKTGARIELHGGTDLSSGEYVEVRGLETTAVHLTAARREHRAPRD